MQLHHNAINSQFSTDFIILNPAILTRG